MNVRPNEAEFILGEETIAFVIGLSLSTFKRRCQHANIKLSKWGSGKTCKKYVPVTQIPILKSRLFSSKFKKN